MNAITRMSAKGQIVIPKDVRDALSWPQGTEIELIQGEKSVTLRALTIAGDTPFDEEAWHAKMASIVDYKGPYYDDVDWKASIDEMFRTGKGVTA